MSAKEIDTTNKWLIGSMGDGFLIMRPPKSLSRDEALVFAAYLVAMTGDDARWQEVLTAVESI